MSAPIEIRDWLDEQDFYELCQQYRHSVEWQRGKGDLTVANAFEALKEFIRKKIEAEIKRAIDEMHDDQRSYS